MNDIPYATVNRIIINHMIETLQSFVKYAEVDRVLFSDETIASLKTAVDSLRGKKEGSKPVSEEPINIPMEADDSLLWQIDQTIENARNLARVSRGRVFEREVGFTLAKLQEARMWLVEARRVKKQDDDLGIH